MSIERASQIIAAFSAEPRADPKLLDISRQLKQSASPNAIADALIESAVLHHPARNLSAAWWQIFTAAAGLIAAGLGARGLYALIEVLPVNTLGLALLPLLSAPLLLVAVLLWYKQRTPEDQKLIWTIQTKLKKIGVAPKLAHSAAVYVAGASATSELLEPSFERPSLARISTVVIGAMVAWTIVSFWSVYFYLMGQTALVGQW